MFDRFGDNDPRKMPRHLFDGVRHLDYSTAVRAGVLKQNHSVCPRRWYVDAESLCARCGQSFVFKADEQRFWYEEMHFWVDSFPKRCATCRKELRELKALQQEYDRDVASSLHNGVSVERKQQLVEVIDAMEAGGVALAASVSESRRTVLSQIERLRPSDAV